MLISSTWTDEAVAKLELPPGKTDHIEWDPALPAFGVRLRPGKRTWIVQYRLGRQQRRESLGDVRKLTIAQARKVARTRFAQVALGIDPAQEKAKASAAAAEDKHTFKAIYEAYLDAKQASKKPYRPHTLYAAKLYFSLHWAPFHRKPINSITRRDVAARQGELIRNNGAFAARRAKDYLSAMFGWAMKQGLANENPTIATINPTEGVQPRDRVLSNDELQAIWRACREDDFGRIVRLLLLTGCRRDEIGLLRWSEIDLDTGILRIGGQRTKNGRDLVLTLPPMARDILASVPRREDREYLFGITSSGFAAWSWRKLELDARLGGSVAPWRLHDLRRTLSTGMHELGVQPHIVEAVLNHAGGHRSGVAGTYNRASYQNEIRAALALWADHVRTIVEGGERKIVAMPRAS